MVRDDGELTIGAALSLSGGNVRQARMAAAGLVEAVEDAARSGGVTVDGRTLLPRLALLDDGGTGKGLHHALDLLAGADLLIGPYGSGLAGEAGQWAAGHDRVVWNHGGSADDVETLPWLVSLASPTSRYLAAVVEAIAGDGGAARQGDSRSPSGRSGEAAGPPLRILIGAGTGSFGRAAAAGASEAAAELGLEVDGVVAPAEVPDRVDADVLLLAGSFDDDVAVLRRLTSRPRVVAAVAAGLSEFRDAVGAHRAEGVLAPSQWEEGARYQTDVGPRAVDVLRGLRSRLAPGLAPGTAGAHVEYPAAQAYAAVLLALHCTAQTGDTNDETLRAAARTLHCTTFFGRFALAADGRQSAHDLLVTQWRNATKCIVAPPAQAEHPITTHPPAPPSGSVRQHDRS